MPNNKGGRNYKKGKKDTQPKKTNIKKTQDTEMYGEVLQTNGNGRFTIRCTDGIERIGIIRGKLRRRMWVNNNSIVLADVWEFQDEKCSILHVYDETGVENLLELGEIPKSFISTKEELCNDFEEDIEIKKYEMPVDESDESSSDDEINLDDI